MREVDFFSRVLAQFLWLCGGCSLLCSATSFVAGKTTASDWPAASWNHLLFQGEPLDQPGILAGGCHAELFARFTSTTVGSRRRFHVGTSLCTAITTNFPWVACVSVLRLQHSRGSAARQGRVNVLEDELAHLPGERCQGGPVDATMCSLLPLFLHWIQSVRVAVEGKPELWATTLKDAIADLETAVSA